MNENFVRVCFDGDNIGEVGKLILSNNKRTIVELENGLLSCPTEDCTLTQALKPYGWKVKVPHSEVQRNPVPIKEKKERPIKAGSKTELAIEVYKAHPGLSRKAMIELFVSEVGLTPAGASTYVHNIKKLLEK